MFDPAADFYMNHVPTCAYRGGKLRRLNGGVFPFPLRVMAYQGEQLGGQQFDSVVSINVLEHVENAFELLNRLHAVLRPGGILVFHDRFFEHSFDAAHQLGYAFMLHPIRLRRAVLDWLVADMDVLFNNCDADHDGRDGEQSYYIIARKRHALAAGAGPSDAESETPR